MTKEESDKFIKKLCDMVHDVYFKDYQEQVRSLTKRIDELEGLIIDIIVEGTTSNEEKIKLFRKGVKGYL